MTWCNWCCSLGGSNWCRLLLLLFVQSDFSVNCDLYFLPPAVDWHSIQEFSFSTHRQFPISSDSHSKSLSFFWSWQNGSSLSKSTHSIRILSILISRQFAFSCFSFFWSWQDAHLLALSVFSFRWIVWHDGYFPESFIYCWERCPHLESYVRIRFGFVRTSIVVYPSHYSTSHTLSCPTLSTERVRSMYLYWNSTQGSISNTWWVTYDIWYVVCSFPPCSIRPTQSGIRVTTCGIYGIIVLLLEQRYLLHTYWRKLCMQNDASQERPP